MRLCKLTEEQRGQVDQLYKQYEETICITAARAKKSWCASYDYYDLIQEGFFCLLRAAGFTSTSGFDKTRTGGASFKTYLVTLLCNWYRDMGNAQKNRSRHVVYVGEYVDSFGSEDDPSIAEEGLSFYEGLWKELSPIAKVILDVRWCNYPKKVPLTQIARLLSIPYEKVLRANREVRGVAMYLREEGVGTMTESSCFGKFPVADAPECKVCVDFRLCYEVFSGRSKQRAPSARTKGGLSMSDAPQEGSQAPLPPPPPPPAPEVAGQAQTPESAAPVQPPEPPPGKAEKSSGPKLTQTDVAFARLLQGPASRKELVAAVSQVFPGTKGARVGMLISKLKQQSLLTDLDSVKEAGPDGKEVSIRRVSLTEKAVETLTSAQQLEVVGEGDQQRYHVSIHF